MRKALLVALLAVMVVATALAAPRGIASPGDQAPDFRLPTAEGNRLSLASLRGKVVLVDFWASWCGPCKASFPALDSLYQDMKDRGFEVVAVDVDEKREDADAFLTERPHAMTVVFDPKGTAPTAFGVEGMPTSFLIGRDGRIRFVHVGYTQKTVDSYKSEIEQLLAEGVPTETKTPGT